MTEGIIDIVNSLKKEMGNDFKIEVTDSDINIFYPKRTENYKHLILSNIKFLSKYKVINANISQYCCFSANNLSICYKSAQIGGSFKSENDLGRLIKELVEEKCNRKENIEDLLYKEIKEIFP